MFNNVENIIRNADQFGANYRPLIRTQVGPYRTVLGGILSIILYGISLAYFSYEIALWQNGHLLPKITKIKQSIENNSFNFRQMVSFQSINHLQKNDFIDPFNSQAIIMQPILYKMVDGKPINPVSLPLNDSQILLSNIELSFDKKNNHRTDYMIAFQKCSEIYLLSEDKCAPQQTINQYFKQSANQISIINYLEQYNPQVKQLEQIEDDFYIAISEQSVQLSQYVYDLSRIESDDGFLLESWKSYHIASSYNLISQQMGIDYSKQYLEQESYLIFQFELSSLQEQEIIEYPKISEILANIGSIVSFFFFFSQIALSINESRLEKEVLRFIVEMFYPEIKQLKITTDLFGKISKITYQNKMIDIFKFKIKYEQLESIAKEKLTILNQIYEMSRLQILIQKLLNRQEIKEAHYAGIFISLLQFRNKIKNI